MPSEDSTLQLLTGYTANVLRFESQIGLPRLSLTKFHEIHLDGCTNSDFTWFQWIHPCNTGAEARALFQLDDAGDVGILAIKALFHHKGRAAIDHCKRG